ncbi:MAG: hypothetical protein GPJ54_19670 [Candidatus Heimdallarchaeota archaeon]|nr:hypothetical protein [Candidatus Heimdallarchaeota archaeon]
MKNILLMLFVFLLFFNTPVTAQEDYRINFELDMTVLPYAQSVQRISQYIQASLAPLGIKVNIIPEGFNEWASHLYEESNSKWDLSIVSWSDTTDSVTNDYSGLSQYDPFYDDIMAYSNKTRQEFQYLDNGVSQDDVDESIRDFRRTFDPVARQEKSDKISQDFLDELLYFLPLNNPLSYRITPESLQGYDSEAGIIQSIYKGVYLDPSENRNASTNELRLQIAGARNPRDPKNSYLMLLDDSGRPHPDFAIQWELSDWDMGNGTIVKNGKNKFWMRDDGYMVQQNTTGFSGEPGTAIHEPYHITLKDWEFSYWLKQQPHQFTHDLDTSTIQKFIFDFNYNENSITAYNSDPFISDMDKLNELQLYPEGILNTTLTYMNETHNITGTPKELADLGINPLLTEEFQYLNQEPMITDAFINTGSRFDFNWVESSWYITDELREKYHFPSELDSPEGDFILHEPGAEEPYFFAYNRTEINPFQKATTLPINTLIYTWRWLKDTNYFAKLFQVDEIDTFMFFPSIENYDLLESFENDVSTRVALERHSVSGFLMYFDLLNPHLQKYKVRRAISMAIDRSVLTQMLDGHYEEWNNPVWPNYSEYNPSIKLDYSYTQARDLMRSEGYFAQESQDFNTNDVSIPPSTITVAKDIIAPMIFPYLFLSAYVARRLKNKRYR